MEKVIKRIQPEDNNDKPSMSMNSAISLNMDFFSKDNKKIPKVLRYILVLVLNLFIL